MNARPREGVSKIEGWTPSITSGAKGSSRSVRIIERTNIPNTRDDVIDGAIGVKFRTGSGIVLVANALVALNNGGLRSRVVPTFGLEYGR